MPQGTVEDQIRLTFPQLTAWGELVKQVFAPSPESALHDDDKVFKWLSTSDVAWQGLCAAQDHLKGFRAWLLANDAPEADHRPGLFPIATFSLLRGALVGGAVASWVLTSDNVEVRVGRSLTVAADWYHHHLAWGRSMRSLAVDPVRHESQLAHVEARAAEVAALRKNRLPRGRLKTTQVIIEANAEVWPDDATRATETLGLWQAGSGDAHALGWSILTRGYEMTPLASEMGQFIGLPSMLDVANAYLCAYDFVAYGFHRLGVLGGAEQRFAGAADNQ